VKNASSHEAKTEVCSEQNIFGCISALWGGHPGQLTTVL
jgi:hypothetical protein